MIAAVGLFAVVLPFACARAQSPTLGQPSPAAVGGVQLPPVIVTGTRPERTPSPQPMSVTVVSKEQIQETPAQSLDDVLRTVVGVNMPLTSMRGLGGIRGLVMLDGIPINDPFFGYIQWNRVPMENIERVEVVRGGGSTAWGNYAMRGAVNIVTRHPGKTEGGVSVGGGSYGTYRNDDFSDVILSDTVKVRGTFNTWGTAGFNQVQPAFGPIYGTTSFNALNGQIAAYFEADPTLTGQFKVNAFSNSQRLLTPLNTNNQQTDDITGSLTKRFEEADLKVTAFHEQSRFTANNPATPAGSATGFGEFVQSAHVTPAWSTGASAELSDRINDVVRTATVGVDVRQISGMLRDCIWCLLTKDLLGLVVDSFWINTGRSLDIGGQPQMCGPAYYVERRPPRFAVCALLPAADEGVAHMALAISPLHNAKHVGRWQPTDWIEPRASRKERVQLVDDQVAAHVQRAGDEVREDDPIVCPLLVAVQQEARHRPVSLLLHQQCASAPPNSGSRCFGKKRAQEVERRIHFQDHG